MTLSINARTASSMNLGYGAAAVNILISLSKLGVDISWFPIGNPYLTVNQHELVQQWIKNQDTFNPDNPSLSVWHENQLAERIGRGQNFAMSYFETDQLNQRQRTHLNSVDHIIAPTSWSKDIMEQNDITVPITKIASGVDTDIFSPQERPPNRKYTFLVMGKWELRKGNFELPTIFRKAFLPTDNVNLLTMCENIFLSPEETKEWHDYYKQYLGDQVTFLPPVATDIELASIMNSVDCGIAISKAEGFDLPALQEMACGCNIIASNYSGHTEFCTKDNAFLIEPTEYEICFDGKWFNGSNGYWMKIGPQQEEQCITHMRTAYKNGPKINTAGIDTAKSLTWDICASKIKSLIESSL